MIIELGYSDDPETKEMSEDVRGKVDYKSLFILILHDDQRLIILNR